MTSILKTTKACLSLSVAAVLLFGMPVQATAQSALSLSVSPTLFEMSANPGQAWSSSVRIINPNPYELEVYAEVVNFAPQGESGQGRFVPVLEEETQGQTLAEWLDIPNEKVVIPPEQTVELPFTIRVPDEVQPGGHFAALLVGTKPPEDDAGKVQVETSQIVTSLVFLRVSGDVVESGSIRSFRTSAAVLERPEATFELRFENTGNVHLQPQGEIVIKNMWGQERGNIPINRETMFGNVLPDSVRKFEFTWNGDWSLADMGRYTAVATLAYGTQHRQFTSSEAAFWVIPWKVLSIVVLSLLAFILFMTWAIKLYIRKMLSMAGVAPGGQSVSADPAAVPPPRPVSVVSPINAGILDLRHRFQESPTWSGRMSTTVDFVQQYKLFFIALLAVLLFLAIIVWYIFAAGTEERSYEVTIEGVEQDLTISSEEMAYEAARDAAPQATTTTEKEIPPMRIVNQSGINGLAAELRLSLEQKGYTITGLSSDFGATENNTVIVYAPEYADEALELSRDIPGALLSAFTDSADAEVPIIVYVGRDYENAVQ